MNGKIFEIHKDGKTTHVLADSMAQLLTLYPEPLDQPEWIQLVGTVTDDLRAPAEPEE